MEDITKINVLGTTYTIYQRNSDEDQELLECDGYCDFTTHSIIIRKEAEVSDVGDYEALKRKNLRHEIIHAFLGESGLQANFQHPEYGHDEIMVDWIAIQYPKFTKVFEELGISDPIRGTE